MTEHRYGGMAMVATSASDDAAAFRHARIRERIGDIERHPATNGLRVHSVGLERLRKARTNDGIAGDIRARGRSENELIAFDSRQRAGVSAQQAYGALHDRIEHRLQVRL